MSEPIYVKPEDATDNAICVDGLWYYMGPASSEDWTIDAGDIGLTADECGEYEDCPQDCDACGPAAPYAQCRVCISGLSNNPECFELLLASGGTCNYIDTGTVDDPWTLMGEDISADCVCTCGYWVLTIAFINGGTCDGSTIVFRHTIAGPCLPKAADPGELWEFVSVDWTCSGKPTTGIAARFS
jgi:hypothetical protein